MRIFTYWLTMKHNNIQLVILDRDGVINIDSKDYIKSPEEWEPIPGSIEAVARLMKHGLHVGIATNQSGIARGYFSENTLHAMHAKMAQLLKAHQVSMPFVQFCPHLPQAGCLCRKPKPGMLQAIMQYFSTSPEHTIMIGDSTKDMEAAHHAGCHKALVRTGNGIATENQLQLNKPLVFDDLAAAVSYLL